MKFKKSFLVFFIWISFFSINAEENKIDYSDNEFNIYSGMFDFSDDGKKSTLIGLQHQNENLNRNTFLGNLSPITGVLITADNAGYVYTGVQAQYKLGSVNLTQVSLLDYTMKVVVKILVIYWNLKVSFKFLWIFLKMLN